MPYWRPMSEFDPTKLALVHDQLNDELIDWKPERYLEHYRQYAALDLDPEKGLVEWDGLLLDGWMERPHAPPR
jgi:hypothetical protein